VLRQHLPNSPPLPNLPLLLACLCVHKLVRDTVGEPVCPDDCALLGVRQCLGHKAAVSLRVIVSNKKKAGDTPVQRQKQSTYDYDVGRRIIFLVNAGAWSLGGGCLHLRRIAVRQPIWVPIATLCAYCRYYWASSRKASQGADYKTFFLPSSFFSHSVPCKVA
jgi:hypothetical protein